MAVRRLIRILLVVFLAVPVAYATSAHTYVASYGSDANTGTASSPYATFQTAVTNTTAGGIVTALNPGDYGAVTISHSITLDGGPGVSVTFTGGEGILISAAAGDRVVLRGITVNGLNAGTDAVYLSSALNLIIEDCHLENFTDIGLALGSSSAQNVVVRNTSITGGTLGVRAFQGTGPDQVSLRGVTISGAASAGIFTRNGVVEISNSVITMNDVGLEADTSAVINIANSVISYNTMESAPFAPSVIDINPNCTLFANNGTGGSGGTPLLAPPLPVPPDRLPSSPDRPLPLHHRLH